MRTTSEQLINDLLARLEQATATVRRFRTLPIEAMNARRAPNAWSLLECIEHLNRYGNFYLPEIEARMLAAAGRPASAEFKSGLIGNYFATLMQVKQGPVKKMKTPANMDPIHSELTGITIERFLKQADMLRSLLEQARQVDLVQVKTSIALTRLIRLRLGDTLRFVVYHIERHVAQAVATQADLRIGTLAPAA